MINTLILNPHISFPAIIFFIGLLLTFYSAIHVCIRTKHILFSPIPSEKFNPLENKILYTGQVTMAFGFLALVIMLSLFGSKYFTIDAYGNRKIEQREGLVPELTRNLQRKKARKIIQRLNSWDKVEINSYETNEYHSGETGGWISSNKEELNKLGYMAIWDSEKLTYELFFGIGVIDPNQAEHITNLLNKNNIQFFLEGSVVYGIRVIAEKSEEAIKILKEDSEKEKYWVQYNNKSITNKSSGR
jgi:hypothetical protein